MSSAPTSDRTVASGTIYKDPQTLLSGGENPEAASTPWWLSSDGEHAHTACPLRPFAHMVVALEEGGDGGWADNEGRRGSGSVGCSALGRISTQQLMASRVVHLSDTLRRKMHSIAPGSAVDRTVGDMLRFAVPNEADDMHGSGGRPNTRMRAVSSGLWNMLGWLVGSNIGASAPEPQTRRAEPSSERPYRRREVAEERADDPLLVGNEGLGSVELAVVRAGRQACVFALCAHALAPATRDEWRAWQATSSQRAPSIGDESLAVVHVAEVSTLHRVACAGMQSVVPPALALEQQFAPLLNTAGALGPAPQLPGLERDEGHCGVDAAVRNMTLLVSRHGLVEMAYPLRPTLIVNDSDDGDGDGDGELTVALGGLLGESLFSRIHPEDVARVVKALRLAWDARPDAYHFARLRREWQRRRQDAASSSSSSATKAIDSRQILHMDGIEVANGVVGLTLQLQVTGAQAAAVDWGCAESMAHHTRFARMQLTRWPLVLRPPRSTSVSSDSSGEPHDGFVLAAIQPLAEPARARTPPLAPPPLAVADAKKRSISSVASSSTLVGLGSSSSLLSSAELVRLCRSASSLSFDDSTARPSLDIPPQRPSAMAIPGSMSKRRSSIAPASLHEANPFGTPRELPF
ncbi:hypothetical protein H4218_000968 [Coemansia sp. IMI 209128]|nr:hypothetical protein H4218_000968 [Coemansia sp. IMI 209128]